MFTVNQLMEKSKVKKRILIIVLAFFVGLGCAFGLYFSGRHLVSVIDESMNDFTEEKINKTFGEYITATKGEGSGNLEVASHETLAVFSETREKSYVWGKFSGGRTSVEIKVPVTYRYYVRLDDPWKIEINGAICTVLAPAIRPGLPPAIHTDRMEKRIDESWIRFDGRQMMDALERQMTPELNRRAVINIPLVREHSRKVVATFIQNWLLQEKQWHDRFHSVVISFADEKEEGTEAAGPVEIKERGASGRAIP